MALRPSTSPPTGRSSPTPTAASPSGSPSTRLRLPGGQRHEPERPHPAGDVGAPGDGRRQDPVRSMHKGDLDSLGDELRSGQYPDKMTGNVVYTQVLHVTDASILESLATTNGPLAQRLSPSSSRRSPRSRPSSLRPGGRAPRPPDRHATSPGEPVSSPSARDGGSLSPHLSRYGLALEKFPNLQPLERLSPPEPVPGCLHCKWS